MECVYAKFFCVKLYREGGKLRIAFASPFLADETQVLPKSSQYMQKRAQLYSMGGLIFGGVFLVLLVITSIVFVALNQANYFLLGMIPYSAYLFFLNIPPVEYASGKTDTLVYLGIKKGYDAEKNMISAMEIQGELYLGKSFLEIDENKYFNLPQLCEDEPLFAVMLDLRYRYYLEKGDYEKAGDCLNRLASAQAYLSDSELERLMGELTYLHSLRGDFESAEECGQRCKTYLQSDDVGAKRILLAYCTAFGKEDAVEVLKAQAKQALERESILGVRKFEEILLSRMD